MGRVRRPRAGRVGRSSAAVERGGWRTGHDLPAGIQPGRRSGGSLRTGNLDDNTGIIGAPHGRIIRCRPVGDIFIGMTPRRSD